MIKKIISGGRKGAERAALDMAIKMEIPHGGWTTKGHTNAMPTNYKLTELSSEDQILAVKKNIRSADGTLVLFKHSVSENLELLKKVIKDQQKPYMFMDLGNISKFEGALGICKWITEKNITVLNVTGEEGEMGGDIHQDVVDILESVIYLEHTEYNNPIKVDFPLTEQKLPGHIDEAVDILLNKLPLKDKVVIAKMTVVELNSLDISLGRFIRDSFGLWKGNEPLLQSCRRYEKCSDLQVENIPAVIIKALWKELKKTHRLRVVE